MSPAVRMMSGREGKGSGCEAGRFAAGACMKEWRVGLAAGPARWLYAGDGQAESSMIIASTPLIVGIIQSG
jgi:hypothetical protein